MPAVHFFDGKAARRQSAMLDMEGDEWVVRGVFGERRAGRSAVEVSEALADSPRFVHFPDGSVCEIDTATLPEFADWLARHRFETGRVARLQMRWWAAAGALLVCLAVVAAVYVWLLPSLAERLAPHVPRSVLESLSTQVMQSLDDQVLKPSRLPQAQRDAIVGELSRLTAGQPGIPAFRLHFREEKGLGPNAFALPSGDIVVFDSLVLLAAGPGEVAAVLAHELGHVHYRHGIRRLIQSSVVSFAVAMYFGDVSSLVTGLTALAMESRYSRQFEQEADRYAVAMMRQAGRDPVALAEMLARLQRAHGEHGGNDWLSSHPETQARIDFIRASRR